MGEVFQVFLVGLNGTHTIDVATNEEEFNSTRIKSFKEKVARKLNEVANARDINIDDIRLVFGNKQLEQNDQTFAQCEILPKSTIFMILRLPGGSC